MGAVFALVFLAVGLAFGATFNFAPRPFTMFSTLISAIPAILLVVAAIIWTVAKRKRGKN